MKIRVTKYNPKYRDDDGAYTNEDWSSISDIGKRFNGEILTSENYHRIETKYVDAVIELCQNTGVDCYYVLGLGKDLESLEPPKEYSELYDHDIIDWFNKIKDGVKCQIQGIENTCRLVLREELWCQIVFVEPAMRITFGYDYYMYFDMDYYDPDLISSIAAIDDIFAEIFTADIPESV